MTLLGPLRSEGNSNNNNRRYRRYCWFPLRVSLARTTQWGTHGWEVTSAVLGEWVRGSHELTGSPSRPHVFGWTLSVGRIRLMFGPKTGWAALKRSELLMLLRKTDSRLASERDVVNARDAEIVRLKTRQAELMARIDTYEKRRVAS